MHGKLAVTLGLLYSLLAPESESVSEKLSRLEDRYRLTYAWQAGDVVVWDNAAVMHSATTLDAPPVGHRTLWRTIISGGVPY